MSKKRNDTHPRLDAPVEPLRHDARRDPNSLARLSRRRFLIGAAGVTVALPLLESLHTAPLAHAAIDRPLYAIWVRGGNGVQQAYDTEPESFWPRTPGALTTTMLRDTNADRATSELSAYASRLTFLRGVQRPFGTPACGHAESITQCLTGARSTGGTSNDPLAEQMSADWRISNQLNPPGREPMVLMAGPTSTYIGANMSWRDVHVRAVAEHSPANQYMRMMGLTTMPPDVQQRIVARERSVNDLVRGEMRALLGRPELSSWDRQRLQQHFDAIRDTELGVMSCDLDPMIAASVGAIPDPEANDVRPEVVLRFMDLMAFGASCGYTRAMSLQVGEGNDQSIYTIGGTVYPRFHWISHRIYSDGAMGETIPNAVELHHNVDRLQLQMFAHLLDRLDGYASPYGGTILDDGVTTWINDLGAGPPHSGENVPWLLAGGCGGRLRTGQFLDVSVQINQVLNTILAAVGCTKPDGSPVDDFGDASLPGGFVSEIHVA
jgi:hypothetical protein